MSNDIIQLPYIGATSGKLLDASLLTVGANSVDRERLVIADDASATGLAPVTSSYGLAVDLRSTGATINVLTSGPLAVLTTGPLQVLTTGPYVVTGTVSVSSGTINVLTTGPYVVTGTVSLSSGTVTLSSNPTVVSASSGVVQVLTTGTLIITGTMSLSSGTVTLSSAPVVNSASSGFVQALIGTSSGVNLYTTLGLIYQVYGSSGVAAPVTSSGGLLVSVSNATAGSGSTAVNVVGTSNGIGPVTTSGGMLVTFTNSVAGSTATNIVGTSNGTAVVTTSGGLQVHVTNASAGSGSTAINLPTVSAAGFAPVTSSYGLAVFFPNKTVQVMLSTIGAPTFQTITSAPAILYSVATMTTVATAQYLEVYCSSGQSSMNTATTFLVGSNPAAAGAYTQVFQSFGGVVCTGGLYMAGKLTVGATTAATAQFRVNFEYAI